MLHQNELQNALGLPLEAVNWHTKDFREIPGFGRYLLMGADGQFREPKNAGELRDYFLGGEFDEVEQEENALDWFDTEDPEEEEIYLWL